MDELQHRLRLIRTHLAPQILLKLHRHFSTTDAIFSASDAQLEALGLKSTQIKRLHADYEACYASEVNRDLGWLESASHGIFFYDSPAYPAQLLEIPDPPFALFYIGDVDYLQQPQLAMVGSRSPTAAGRQIAENFARHLSTSGITITSGLALGIDTASHQGALKGIGGSVAVVANGLHTIYPKANTQLAEAVSQNGCVVSESAVGVAPHKGLFPRRNRIISGLSMGTLVTEAAINSGSLITTRHAMEQGREIFAIPGSIHNPLAKGCHELIKSGARLVETAQDILEELIPLVNSGSISHTSVPEGGFQSQTGVKRSGEKGVQSGAKAGDIPGDTERQITHEVLDPEYQMLLKHMGFEPVGIDELVERSCLSVSEVASMLLILELRSEVVAQNGLYSRIDGALMAH